jgi:hypothetical protein
MADVVMLACYVWAIVFWVEGLEENRDGLLLWASLLVVAAALTKYFGISLLLLLGVYVWRFYNRKAATGVAFLILPLLVLGAYEGYGVLLYDHGRENGESTGSPLKTETRDVMNQFKIEDSFAIHPDLFVFAGTLVQGRAGRGMTFEVPEAGHKWALVVRDITFIRKKGGSEILGLVVDNPTPSYLPGLGIGWTAELCESQG